MGRGVEVKVGRVDVMVAVADDLQDDGGPFLLRKSTLSVCLRR